VDISDLHSVALRGPPIASANVALDIGGQADSSSFDDLGEEDAENCRQG
jgi:hypothetical protein